MFYKSINDLGWQLVNADKSAGIIEATDTTTWFGFTDDVITGVPMSKPNARYMVEIFYLTCGLL